MDITYIISQILVLTGYIILGIGIRKEKRITILYFVNLFYVFLISSYSLLGATLGTISCIVSFLKNFLLIYNEKKNKNTSIWILLFLVLITIGLTIWFYETPVDILPCAISIVTIFTIASRSTMINRLGSIFESTCWIIYAIAFRSWFAVFCESYLVICAVSGLIKHNLKTN